METATVAKKAMIAYVRCFFIGLFGEIECTSFAVLKDTVKVNPGYFTTIRAKFELPAGVSAPQRYVYHCHIIEHEDNDMMRPFEVIA